MKELMQREIVWVRFPFSDLGDVKFRPAVIVSNNSYNKKSPDVVICGITSNLDSKEYSVFVDNSNLESGKIPMRSRIRADKTTLLEKRMIDRPFAKIDTKTFDSVSKEISKLVKAS